MNWNRYGSGSEYTLSRCFLIQHEETEQISSSTTQLFCKCCVRTLSLPCLHTYIYTYATRASSGVLTGKAVEQFLISDSRFLWGCFGIRIMYLGRVVV